jgi:hypothetical protein
MHRGVVSILLSLFLLSGCLELRVAYLPDSFLTGGWHEADRESGSSYLGIERWTSIVYKNGESYLRVTTIKTLIMMDREELLKMTLEMIERNGYDISNRSGGHRVTANGHESSYVVYNGTKGFDKYKIIGEVWSCSRSGISVTCIGLAKVSEVAGLENWREIVADLEGSIGVVGNGMIYNINCH